VSSILVIEDDPSLCSLLRLSLETAGYRVTTTARASMGADILKESDVDLVILDLMLPDAEGFTLLPAIRSKEIPVIILTARDSLGDKIRGLEGGADDYVTKPFEPLELIARIRSVLRRRGADRKSLAIAGLTIDVEARTVARDGARIRLTRMEFGLLLCLAEHKGMALTREQLLQTVWGYHYAGTTRTVDVHVQRLREKLATNAIVTVMGMGYRLEG
jgi:two-component system, OmpR family, alkaline phosphatase synthesis response regulator PhoP